MKAEADRAEKAETRVVELEAEIRSLREADAAQRAAAQETVEDARAETGRTREEVAELRGRLAVLTEQATRYWETALPQDQPHTAKSETAQPDTLGNSTPTS